jgi:hypothetical protein
MSKAELQRLLFGNGNGAVVLEFAEARLSLQVLWSEFMMNLNTIQVWGERPFKRRFYDALHNLTSIDSRKALFERLALEVDGDRALSYDLAAAMATKTQSDARSALTKELHTAKDIMSLSLEQPIIQPISKYVDDVIEGRMRSTYGEFISLSDPIITSNDVDGMVEECKRLLPIHWRSVQELLGYDTSSQATNGVKSSNIRIKHLWIRFVVAPKQSHNVNKFWIQKQIRVKEFLFSEHGPINHNNVTR